MGSMSRRKGAKGQGVFARMLRDRDWTCDQLTAGLSTADMVATDPSGKTWLVEVKNCSSITAVHKTQAIEQGRLRRMPWLLACHIADSSSWLVQRQHEKPEVWHQKTDMTNG